MKFEIEGRAREISLEAAVIAGYTGRDRKAVDAHIDELAEQGIAPPATVPAFFSISPDTLTFAEHIEVLHMETSGEVEILIVVDNGETFVGIASDHTDRRTERLDIGVSKQLCRKPIGHELWPLETVQDRWDELHLASDISISGVRSRYQEGLAATNISPMELLEMVPFELRPKRYVLFTGTIPVMGGIRHADRFDGSVTDLAQGRSLRLSYEVLVQNWLDEG